MNDNLDSNLNNNVKIVVRIRAPGVSKDNILDTEESLKRIDKSPISSKNSKSVSNTISFGKSINNLNRGKSRSKSPTEKSKNI